MLLALIFCLTVSLCISKIVYISLYKFRDDQTIQWKNSLERSTNDLVSLSINHMAKVCLFLFTYLLLATFVILCSVELHSSATKTSTTFSVLNHDNQISLVKFAGNNPFCPSDSLIPMSQPSSCSLGSSYSIT